MDSFATDMEVSDESIAAWVAIDQAASLTGALPFVELELPEYAAAGLGKAFCRAKRFRCGATGQYGYIARSICADSSRFLIVTSQMRPVVLGHTHDELQTGAPKDWLLALYDQGMPIDLVSLAAVRAKQFQQLDELVEFVGLYHERASWLEAHPLDVAITNLESQSGAAIVFDGSRLFCAEV